MGASSSGPNLGSADDSRGGRLPVTVVVPTVGRRELLEVCLDSLLKCRPAPAEVLVIDQSDGRGVGDLVAPRSSQGFRSIRCEGRGVSRAVNLGMREAVHETVLVTHDDCAVAPGWIEAAATAIRAHPGDLITGRVRPGGDDPRAVPSIKDHPDPQVFRGLSSGDLYPNNMALHRGAALALGGFDERLRVPAGRRRHWTGWTGAEDNDFCYRWLRSGRVIRYDPNLVVWHHDWRTKEQLEALYIGYWRAQGQFYGKHLRLGDWRIGRFVIQDLRSAFSAMLERMLTGRPRWSDSRRGLLAGLPEGVVLGWRQYKDSAERLL